MDATSELVIFLCGTFAAAFVTGLAGFAFGLVAAAIWLHALSPAEATPLIVAYALLVQGYAVWKLRRSLNYQRLLPLMLGSGIGVPLGATLLHWASAEHLRVAVGVVLVLFSLRGLLRPAMPQLPNAGRSADAVIGVINGIIGASTGLAGIAVVIWSGMRGWPRDEQRAVFQPVAVASFLIIAIWFVAAKTVTFDVARLFLLGLPMLLAGAWLGWVLYGRLDEAKFRKLVLGLLLLSGLALLIPRS